MKKTSSITITIAALFLFVSTFIFQCPKKDDGSYMHCHNANVAIATISGVVIILGILLLVLNNKALRLILSVITVLASIICALIPEIIVSLCMMPEMTCRATFRPIAIICSVIILLFTLAGLIFGKRS